MKTSNSSSLWWHWFLQGKRATILSTISICLRFKRIKFGYFESCTFFQKDFKSIVCGTKVGDQIQKIPSNMRTKNLSKIGLMQCLHLFFHFVSLEFEFLTLEFFDLYKCKTQNTYVDYFICNNTSLISLENKHTHAH